MKVQLFLIGLVAVLSLGALTLTDAVPLGSHHGNGPTTATSPSPSPESSESPEASPEPSESPEASPSAHPCNHGFYVSQAAQAHKGGAYTSQIARSDLGKNGSCTAPLPNPSASTTAQHGESMEAGG